MRKHVLVVVAKEYNGHELFITLKTLSQHDVGFTLVSRSRELCDEITGQQSQAHATFEGFSVEEFSAYDGLVLVSGKMHEVEFNWRSLHVQAYVKEAMHRGMVMGAICISVPALLPALAGKRVSFFPLVRARAMLEGVGAIPQPVSITVDGRIVTAEYQMAAQPWIDAICDLLEGKTPELNLRDSGFRPRGRPRRGLPKEVKEWQAALQNS